MRITAELLAEAEQRTNPLGDRELVLRERGIAAIENMGAARDEFDAWDLSDNRLLRLENFPRLPRLTALYCAGNSLETVDARNMSNNVPNVTTLILTQNAFRSLAEVETIAKACPKLEFLSLVGNPVTRKFFVVIILHGCYMRSYGVVVVCVRVPFSL
jgi:U2 small nuclear ribonucleoprotein A'